MKKKVINEIELKRERHSRKNRGTDNLKEKRREILKK